MIQGRFLVRGNVDDGHCPPTTTTTTRSDDRPSTTVDDDDHCYTPMFLSDTALSFWGGIDPMTGRIIDTLHPLYNTCISHQILCIPSSRGSCTTSQVVLELILRGTAPRAIVVRDANDAVLCIGAMIAQEFFPHVTSNICPIVAIGTEGYQQLLRLLPTDASSLSTPSTQPPSHLQGYVTSDGHLRIRNNDGTVLTLPSSPSPTSLPMETTTTCHDQHSDLSLEEQTYLDQSTTDAERRALKVIFQYAKLFNQSTSSTSMQKQQQQQQRRYIPIQQSHIDGCTYIGPGGLQFVQQLLQAGGRVKVPTTLNAVSTDRRYWSKHQVPVEYAQNANALGDAYVALGCQPTFTCAPYLLLPSFVSPSDAPPTTNSAPSVPLVTHTTTTTTATSNHHGMEKVPPSPLFGKDIAWGESNAVVYANSVLGARTEKYADYLDICCALTGIVPQIGVHCVENRIPTVHIDGTTVFQTIQSLRWEHQNEDVESQSSTILDLDVLFPLLGHLCGRWSDGRVPILTGFDFDRSDWNAIISTDHLKSFCAAFGTTASSPLIHIAGITPEAKDPTTIQTFISTCDTTRTISLQDLHETFHQFNASDNSDEDSIDLVALGNPHLSSSECTDLARIIEQVAGVPRTTDAINDMLSPTALSSSTTRIIACISRDIYARSNPNDIRVLHDFGIEFIYDTCWCMILDAPIIPLNPLGIIMTNSGKYAHYGPGLTNRRFRFGSMYDCIYAARYGHAPIRKLPSPDSNDTDASRASGLHSVESSLSRSSSVPTTNIPANTTGMDPYLSFLLRPSKPRPFLQNQTNHRNYCTSTMSCKMSHNVRTRTMNVPKRRIPLATTTLGNAVHLLSLMLKQFI